MVVWNGTNREQTELLSAVEHNCECDVDEAGVRRSSCSSHGMLVHDQRALNGLLWTRRLLNRLLAEEGITAGIPMERPQYPGV